MNLTTRYRMQFGKKRPGDKTLPDQIHETVRKLIELRKRGEVDPPVDVFMRRGEDRRRFDYAGD